jgi:hypothetical protein
MVPRLLPLLLVAACASKGGEGVRGQGEEEVVLPAAPAGDAWETARKAPWKEILEDLAKADVAYVSGDRAMELAVLDYLFRRGRLHAIALDTFPRTAQKELEEFSFARIDEAELAKTCAIADADRPVLAFARERRIPILGLRLEQEIRDGIRKKGPDGFPLLMDGLSEAQRLSLPALPSATHFEGPNNDPFLSLERKLELAVAADVVVGWYRDMAPEGAQVAVLAATASVAPREGLPDVLFARNGKTYRTLVALDEAVGKSDSSVFAKSYADYVWFLPAK